MTRDDDSTWLDALAGRSAESGSTVTSEARALRREILEQEAEEIPAVPLRDPAREEELIARAVREGLLPGRRRARSWTAARGLLAAAALAGVAVVVVLALGRPGEAPEPVRRGAAGIVRLDARSPIAEQRAILGELREAGIEATAYERLGLMGIDADLPQPTPESVRRVLARHGIPVPADGVLRVEIGEPGDR